MTTCIECTTEFDVEEARAEYNSEFGGELDYDEYGAGHCASCAISETESNMNHGRAILMMNGEEDYDDDFVQNNL
ncbi:hypothetical protein [Streptomyces sp. cf124]|uniref:hypothetical protein n=1 Tax=Streptomyces sp. cf124 TaxID=1761903 RepID=UPI0011607D55|nr:hypothetical protein [Streptomyces sp. cf124]